MVRALDGNLATPADPAQFPMVLVAFLAAGIGSLAGLIAYVVIVTYPDEALSEASARMLRKHIGRLPVVNSTVGYLARRGTLAAGSHRLDEEHVREPGWIKRPNKNSFSGRAIPASGSGSELRTCSTSER
jgi:CBS domain-containing protein